jgi:hypothetical protein
MFFSPNDVFACFELKQDQSASNRTSHFLVIPADGIYVVVFSTLNDNLANFLYEILIITIIIDN